jgi:SAM-dependent methyltransferase
MDAKREGFLYTEEDDAFDRRYPVRIERMSPRHWTPVQVAREAAKLLVRWPGTRVLDVGCGPGKFCAIGALVTEGHFTGVEQRPRMSALARAMIANSGIDRVEILTANIVEITFSDYDAFYIFNPFQENVLPGLKIDSTVDLGADLYDLYIAHVQRELASMPEGTRVVTYHGMCDEIPPQYDCAEESFAGLLKLWIKSSAA